MEEIKEWKGFDDGIWRDKIDVRDFIINNYTKYEGDDSFLKGPTEKTKKLWEIVSKLLKEETQKGGVLDADTSVISNILSQKTAPESLH